MLNRIKKHKKWGYFLIVLLLLTHLISTSNKLYFNRPIPTLLFHSIGESSYKSDIWGISKERFTSVLDELKKHGYRTLTINDIRETISKGVYPETPPYCLLTFDDGCQSHLNIVVPELLKRSFSGVFFVPFPPEEDTQTRQPGLFLAPDKFRKLAAAGDVQSHSKTFETLTIKPGESPTDFKKRMKENIGDYKVTLEKIVDHPVYALAYPSGEYDNMVLKATKTWGHQLAFTTEYGKANHRTDPLLIPRYMITSNDSLDDILHYVRGERAYETATVVLEIIAIILCIFLLMKKQKIEQKLSRH